MALKVGLRAPNFAARATGGRQIALFDWKGKSPVVLWFFPLAFGPVCAEELPMLERAHGDFASAAIQLVALSVDSVFAQNAFAASLGGLSFPLVGDLDRRVCSMYGVLRPEGFCERATYAIDAEGIIRWVRVDDLAAARDPKSILEAVRAELAPKASGAA